jgi:hypothetical protein
VANDDSMFAIRQRHLLSFFIITPTAPSPGHGPCQLEATRTVTFSLQTHLSAFLPQSQCDLRSEDLTSKARLARYLEANQPISVTPTRTLIRRCGPGVGASKEAGTGAGEELQVTVLGSVGTETLTNATEQFILATSLPVTSAIYTAAPVPGSAPSPPPCLLLHTCCSLGKVQSSTTVTTPAGVGIGTGAGIIATIDPDEILRVLDTSLLHSTLWPLLQELSVAARSNLPSEREDLEVWENIKSLREAQFISRQLFSHEALVGRACLGTFRMRNLAALGGTGRVRYAMAISRRAGGAVEGSRGELSVFISRSERGKRSEDPASPSAATTGATLYEVFL